jgi:hypothetical protein
VNIFILCIHNAILPFLLIEHLKTGFLTLKFKTEKHTISRSVVQIYPPLPSKNVKLGIFWGYLGIKAGLI